MKALLRLLWVGTADFWLENGLSPHGRMSVCCTAVVRGGQRPGHTRRATDYIHYRAGSQCSEELSSPEHSASPVCHATTTRKINIIKFNDIKSWRGNIQGDETLDRENKCAINNKILEPNRFHLSGRCRAMAIQDSSFQHFTFVSTRRARKNSDKIKHKMCWKYDSVISNVIHPVHSGGKIPKLFRSVCWGSVSRRKTF